MRRKNTNESFLSNNLSNDEFLRDINNYEPPKRDEWTANAEKPKDYDNKRKPQGDLVVLH